MSWIIRNEMKGPLELNGIGIMMTPGQIVDLDIIGRANAEQCNAVKVATVKNWISILRKDPAPPGGGGVSPEVVVELKQAAEKASTAAAQMAQQSEQQQQVISQQQQVIDQQQRAMEEQKRHGQEMLSKADQILAEVKAFADSQPLLARTIKEGLQNAMAERAQIAGKREELAFEADAKADLKAHSILADAKDRKLQKNMDNIAKTVSGAGDINEVLDAMDELGL